MNYTQLTYEQRYQIAILKKAGHFQVEIAKLIGVNKSTVSRELRRNHGRRGYWTAPKIVDTNLIPKWNDMRSVYEADIYNRI